MNWKGMGEREIVLLLLAWLVGRVDLLQVNPFSIAIFTAICFEGVAKRWFLLAIGLGLWSGCSFQVGVKYTLAMGMAAVVFWLIEKRKERGALLLYAVVSTGSVAVANGILGIWKTRDGLELSAVLLEFLLAGVMVPVLYVAVHFFLTGKKYMYANNEEMIAGMVLVSLCVYGMPFQENHTFSVSGFFVSFFVLYMGYRYGAGAGSLAGAISGLFFVAGDADITRLGIMVVLGVAAGVFRELGRIISGITYVGSYLICGVYFDNRLMVIEELRALVVMLFVFFLLPRHLTKKMESFCGEEAYTREKAQQIEGQVKRRLEHFAEPFFQMAATLTKLADVSIELKEKDMEWVLCQVQDGLCVQCEKKNRCHGFSRMEKYQTASCILGAAKEYGYVTAEDFPVKFSNKCAYMEEYVAHTNAALRFAHNNTSWERRWIESREAVAEQLQDMGYLLRELGREFDVGMELEEEQKRELVSVLKRNQILSGNIETRRNNKHCQEIALQVKGRPRSCITTREVAKCVSEVLEKSYVPVQGSRHVLNREFENLVLVEDTKFKALTGVARCQKEGEQLCGDNYSFIRLEQGELVMALADGTGTGESACSSSTSVIELLEGFLEAGVGERTAIRLINSICVLQKEEQPLSTLDLVVLNLYTGVCEFVKLGGATAFVKRGEEVETVTSATLPLGIFSKVDYQDTTKKLYDGDWIILMSDGVLDSMGGEEKEVSAIQFLQSCTKRNPTELANGILERAIVNGNGKIVDDMTVLVTRVWKNG